MFAFYYFFYSLLLLAIYLLLLLYYLLLFTIITYCPFAIITILLLSILNYYCTIYYYLLLLFTIYYFYYTIYWYYYIITYYLFTIIICYLFCSFDFFLLSLFDTGNMISLLIHISFYSGRLISFSLLFWSFIPYSLTFPSILILLCLIYSHCLLFLLLICIFSLISYPFRGQATVVNAGDEDIIVVVCMNVISGFLFFFHYWMLSY